MNIKSLKTLKIFLSSHPLLFLSLFFFSSCAFISAIREDSGSQAAHSSVRMSSSKFEYNLKDHAGEFILIRESGPQSGARQYAVRRLIIEDGENKSPLERTISISQMGSMNQIRIMRPKVSQYSVWFEGERYYSEMEVDAENKILKVMIDSPDEQLSGSEQVSFPAGSGVYCFFTQLIECAKITGFLSLAVENQDGAMNFHIIWDGYPYIQLQYPGIPDEVFSGAMLEFDGHSREGHHRFALNVGGQTIFYHLDQNFKISGKYWVAQGLSITRK